MEEKKKLKAAVVITKIVLCQFLLWSSVSDAVQDNVLLSFLWNEASGNPLYYNIYISVDNGEYVFGGISFQNKFSLEAERGRTYKIRVEAVDTAGNVGPLSDESEAVILPPADEDNDLLPDEWEREYLSDLSFSAEDDPDNDGLNNLEEYNAGTDPANPDTDGDSLSDSWEIQYGLNPLLAEDAQGDLDGDGFSNLEEYLGGSDPNDQESFPLTNNGYYWPFDEGEGTIVHDIWNSNDGVTHGPQWVNVDSGYALEFDGVDDFVEVGATPSTKSAITIEFWFRPNSQTKYQWMLSRYYGNDRIALEWRAKLYYSFVIGGNTYDSYVTTSAPNIGQWYHCAFTYDGSHIRVYLDGEEIHTASASGQFDYYDYYWEIGARANAHNKNYNGLIDEVKIYERVLTQEEIIADMSDE